MLYLVKMELQYMYIVYTWILAKIYLHFRMIWIMAKTISQMMIDCQHIVTLLDTPLMDFQSWATRVEGEPNRKQALQAPVRQETVA